MKGSNPLTSTILKACKLQRLAWPFCLSITELKTFRRLLNDFERQAKTQKSIDLRSKICDKFAIYEGRKMQD